MKNMDNDMPSLEATHRGCRSHRVGSLRDIIHLARGSKTSSQGDGDMENGNLNGMEAVALRLRPMRRCTLPVASSETQERIEMWLDGFEVELKDTLEDKDSSKVEESLQLLVRMHPELTSISNRRWFGRATSTVRKRSTKTARKMDEGAWETFFFEMESWKRRLEEAIDHRPVTDRCLLWDRARWTFLRKIVSDTLRSLEGMDEPPCPIDTFTGGVSYVKPSESRQLNVDEEYALLPPLVIQPPNLRRMRSEMIDKMIETIKEKEVLLTRMPDRDDAMIKGYLLNDVDRRETMRVTAGAGNQIVQGVQSICPMFGDHVFLCCHYRLDEEGRFVPCTDTKKASKLGIEGSNVQLVIIVRKGIGGTWALRNAAKYLDELHILPLITGNCTLTEMDFSTDNRSIGSVPRKKPCLAPIDPICSVASSSSAPVRSVSVKAEKNNPPPVCQTTMTDWFASVQSTAGQILETASRSNGVSKTPTENQKRSGSRRLTNAEESYSKATSNFMQKTLKRRLTTCKSTTPANIKIHTLSCRLEMFVSEAVWKQLDMDMQNALHSTVMGIEEWLRDQLQNWNRERLMHYCRQLTSSLDVRLREIAPSSPEANHDQSAKPISPAADQGQGHTPEVLDVEEEAMKAILEEVPELPTDVDGSAGSTIKATAVAGNVPSAMQPEIPWPFYLIGTRDCFTYDLIEVKKQICKEGRTFVRTDFYFHEGQIPEDYGAQRNPGSQPLTDGSPSDHDGLVEISPHDWEAVDGYPSEAPTGARPVGVTTYASLFTHEELNEIESEADRVHEGSKMGIYPPECFHPTIGKNGALRRTKYFFGARYLWTKEQLAEPDAHVAKGVRVDVPPNPIWMKQLVEDPLVSCGIVGGGFVNSWALNMYHDGSEGIQSHFDDSQRFCQPIYSMRLFSDSRLSFGTQLYGFTNGAFSIPMPRGCITIMHDRSYAANAIKHCVRPCDMTGKSAGLIMRKINSDAWNEAVAYHMSQTIDWLKKCRLDDVPRKSAFYDEDGGFVEAVGGSDSLTRLEVVDTTAREVDSTEKHFKKERRHLQHEEMTVTSVMNNLIKKVERDVMPAKRKRRNNSFPASKHRSKTTSQEAAYSNESFIVAASQILEKIMERNDSPFLQKVCNLLRKCGNEWIQALCAVREHDPPNIDFSQTNFDRQATDAVLQRQTSSNASESVGWDNLPVKSIERKEGTSSSQIILRRQSDGVHRLHSTSNTDTPHVEFVQSLEEHEMSNKRLMVKNKEPKALLSDLLEVALKEAALDQSASTVDSLQTKLNVSDDILKRVLQETESVDFGSLIDGRSTIVPFPFSRPATSKRRYRLAPWNVCFKCEKPGHDPRSVPAGDAPDDALWLCRGPCRRWFHLRCVEPSIVAKCAECTTGHHRCHLCGEGSNHMGSILKCTHGVCGRHYHVQCVMQIKETKVLHVVWKPVGSVTGDTSCLKFKCPQHYCKSCGKSGANKSSVACIRCPTAYHTRCRPASCLQLSKKVIVCPRHLNNRSGE